MRTNDAAAEVAPVAHEPHSDLKRVAASSFLGNFIEWFDYATYTYFAITIGQVFFPGSEVNSTLMAFAIFALAFIFRPLGAMFWGSMGDKKGRKQSLAISVLLMSGAAFLIGCLPSYQAIGLASPILLLVLRSVQGFSVAGEYSGAAVFLAEYAPPEKRGRYCSLVPASTATGLLAGSTMALVLKMVLPEAAIIEWGWRIPFLLAGPLGFIAHYIRTKLEDSPAFVKMEEGNKEAEHPTHLVFKKYRKRLLSSVAATMVNAVGFYLVLTYLPTYLTSYTSMEASQAQLATDIALIAYLLIIFGSGTLSDKVGRRRMLLTACVAFIVLSIPCFLMLGDGVAAHRYCRRADHVRDAVAQRCEHRLLSGGDVPHGSALHRCGFGFEHCLCGVRRHGVVCGHGAHRRHRQRAHASFLHDGHQRGGRRYPVLHSSRL